MMVDVENIQILKYWRNDKHTVVYCRNKDLEKTLRMKTK